MVDNVFMLEGTKCERCGKEIISYGLSATTPEPKVHMFICKCTFYEEFGGRLKTRRYNPERVYFNKDRMYVYCAYCHRDCQVAKHKVEMILGNRLPKKMVVHHIDHNPMNDRIDNLMVLTKSEHTRYHATWNFKV